MHKTRENHYVPQWHQKGFLANPNGELYYLDVDPDIITDPDGNIIRHSDGTPKTHKNIQRRPTSRCFSKTDLYTTFFGHEINDDIERRLFGGKRSFQPVLHPLTPAR